MSLIIVIQNDGTGDDLEGNYDFEIRINKDIVHRGRIENHLRLSGWKGLIRLLAQEFPKEE